MKSYSQYFQDFFVNFLFSNKREGVFIDIGANDGISFSNTYHFEKLRNWTGLCVEPHPEIFNKLKTIRNCFLENCCVTNNEQTVIFRKIVGPDMLSGILEFMDDAHKKRIDDEIKKNGGKYDDIEIKAYNINTLLEKYNFTTIDYCSIDTEGAEYEIVTSIDFAKYNITAFSVEGFDENLACYLKKKGYKYIISENDTFYIKQGTKRIFLFTMIVRFYKFYWKIRRRLPKFHVLLHGIK